MRWDFFSPRSVNTIASLGRNILGGIDEQFVQLAGEVRDHGEHRSSHTTSNFTRGLFPIMVDDSVVACLDTGPLKLGPFSSAESKAWVKASDLSKSETNKAIAEFPVLSARQVGRVLSLYRSLARGFSDRLRYLLAPSSSTGEAMAQTAGPHLGSHAGSLSASPLIGGLSRHYHKLLSVLLGYGAMLDGREDLSPDVQASIDRIMTTASQGKELAELLFDEGWEKDCPQETSLHEVINTFLPLIDAHRSGSVQLLTDLVAREDLLFCRRSDLHQLLFELLSLGLDLAPINSMVTLHTEQTRSPKPDSDSPGIALRLFDAASAPFDETAAHLTLGLSAFGPVDDVDIEARLSSLVRRVQALGGTFKVQPQAACMTALEVILPIEHLDLPSPASRDAVPPSLASSMWVVDDDPVFCAVCEDILVQAGHEVTELRGVEGTKELWNAGKRPDLLVLDYTLEDGDGPELGQWIDQNGGAIIPIILASSLTSTHPAVAAMLDRPKTYFLGKPLQRIELEDTVRVALGLTLVG